MRSYLVLPILLLSVLSVGCERTTLVGPEAQRAYSRVQIDGRFAPTDAMVFIDNQRHPSDQPLTIDPKSITRIEVLKGGAAVRLYGEQARAGVVHIYTVHGSSPDPSRDH